MRIAVLLKSVLGRGPWALSDHTGGILCMVWAGLIARFKITIAGQRGLRLVAGGAHRGAQHGQHAAGAQPLSYHRRTLVEPHAIL